MGEGIIKRKSESGGEGEERERKGKRERQGQGGERGGVSGIDRQSR